MLRKVEPHGSIHSSPKSSEYSPRAAINPLTIELLLNRQLHWHPAPSVRSLGVGGSVLRSKMYRRVKRLVRGVMKRLLVGICIIFGGSMHATRVTVFNKSADPVLISFKNNTTTLCEQQRIAAHRSKVVQLPAVSDMQSTYLEVVAPSSHWPSLFVLQRMSPQEIALKRDSLVISRKQTKGARDVAHAPLKIAYYGKSASQEVGFL